MNHLENWGMGLLVTAVLLVASALLDGPDDLQAEADTSAAVADAREAARDAAEREHNAAQICTELHGPGAAHLWDAAGSLHCLSAPTRAAPTTVAQAR